MNEGEPLTVSLGTKIGVCLALVLLGAALYLEDWRLVVIAVLAYLLTAIAFAPTKK